jgi:outer membrane receptor protein involved in Fe transport
MNRIRGAWFTALLALVLTPCSAPGQAVYGAIYGTVTDATGALIPNAPVVVEDTAKGTKVTATANESGEFRVEHLIPDAYSVSVESAGFKKYEQTGIQVNADSSAKIDVVLSVGTAGEVVTVNADTVPQLKTDRADVAVTYSAQDIETLPIADHNFTNLQLLLPGAVQLGWAHAADENPQGSKQIQIDGQAFGGVNYTLDGTDNQDAILGIIVINPNYESMSEAKIATQNFDAEFGKAVASVQTVQTKSGTNSFHGTLFDNRESNANLARDPFTVSKAAGYPGGLKNQFGGSIGGPILKDKAFFFGDYQGVRQKVGSSGIGTVPSLLALQSCTGATTASNGTAGCDFSQYLAVPGHQIYNNASGTPVPYVNNIIPLTQLSPQALNLFKLLLANGKVPNTFTTDNGLTSNYAGSGTGIFNSNQWDVRVDTTFFSKAHAFVRASRFTDVLSGASLFGPAGGPGLGIAGYGGVSDGANDSYAAGVDVAVNSNLVTDVRLGYFRYNIITHKNDTGNTNLPFLGQNISGTAPNQVVPIDYGTPDVNIADVTATTPSNTSSNAQNTGAQFGSGLNMNHCNCPLTEREDQFQLVNNWTKTIRNHAIKFGVDLRYARNLRVPSDSDRTGLDNIANGPTSNGTNGGLGFASFILGDVFSFARYASTSTNAKEFQPRDYFYVQDTWRESQKLTLNLGIRYEYYAPERVNGVGNGALLNLNTGYINVAGVGPIGLNMNVAAAKNTWNPRVGIAYQATPKTVIRAGYGRSFDLGVFGSDFGHVVTQNVPVLANQSLSGTSGPTSYAFNLSDPTNTNVPGIGKPVNATNPLAAYVPPAANSNGQIPITEILPGTGASIGSQVQVKARPFTERLPTLDAWNIAIQHALTPTMSVEAAYVGNKGTHTLSDGDNNNTNPNEAAISLPGSFTQNGVALHYDPTVKTGVSANGGTANTTLLQRYTNGTLAACGGGACGWTQAIGYYGDDQDTHYNALQTKFTKTFSQGLSLNLNYSYQHGVDTASSFATWDKAAVIGPDSAIRRSAFTSYGLWQLPFGRNQMFASNVNSWMNGVIGGWEFSPVVVWQSGLPFSLSYSDCAASVPGDAPCQPNGNVKKITYQQQGTPGVGSGVHLFSPVIGAADLKAGNNLCNASSVTGGFTCPGLDQIGNIRRDTAFGSNLLNSDMSLMKNVSIAERVTAQFRFDAFNALNHINLATPNGAIDQTSSGAITGGPYPTGTGGTTNPRQLQFTLHLQF